MHCSQSAGADYGRNLKTALSSLNMLQITYFYLSCLITMLASVCAFLLGPVDLFTSVY